MRVKFAVRREVQDEHRGTDKATIYEAGQVYDLPEASASRWISRGVAIAIEDPAAGAGAGTKRKGREKPAKAEGNKGAGGDKSTAGTDSAAAGGEAGQGEGGDPAQGNAAGEAEGGQAAGDGAQGQGEDPGAATTAGSSAPAGETEAKA